MKVKRLALIVIAAVVASIVGCDEAAMVDDLIIDGLTEEGEKAIKLAQLRAEPNGDAVSTHPNPVDREKILSFLNPGDEGFEEWHKLVLENSIRANVLDITGCTANPLVIAVGHGEAIEVKNRDTTDHVLSHGLVDLTVPAGGSRRIILSRFGAKGDSDEEGEGFAGYACDRSAGGIFHTNPKLQKHVYFQVVQFLFPNGESGPGMEGARITPLVGSNEGTKETFADGIISFSGELPLTVLIEKGDTVTEVTVTKKGDVIVLPIEQNISFRVVEPLFPHGRYGDWPIEGDRNGPGIEGVTVTCLEGSDEGIKETDPDGQVSFFGTPPLTVRIEKEGYITTEAMIGQGGEIVFPNQWPEEANEAIRQLGLAEFIASGDIILRWGEDEYLSSDRPYAGGGGRGYCRVVGVIIIVRDSPDRREMIGTLVHELAHTWAILKSIGTLCHSDDAGSPWPESEEGRAWLSALEKDLQEVGVISGFDDHNYGGSGILLKDRPRTSLAEFYKWWHTGFHASQRNPENIRQLAPNRCKYMEDRFGLPPR